jgi:DNA-directed RNA polymerase specialized sigma24 family protein
MTIEDQLYKKLRHLVSTITACNFIDYESKKDIVQDVMIILTSKIENGSLVNDYDKIEGYSFMVLRNYCAAWHLKEKKRETPVAEFWEIKDDSELEADNIEYKEYLHTLAKNYIQQSKYNEDERLILDKLLEDYSDKEIVDSTSISAKQLGQYKFRIKVKLKYDVLRPVKYFIKSVNNKDLSIPCFTRNDVKKFFTDISARSVNHFIYSGFVTKDGYYVETLFKDNRGKKKHLS